MSEKIKFISFIRKWGVIFILGGILLIKGHDLLVLYKNYNHNVKKIRKEFFKEQKRLIKTEVDRVVLLLDSQEKQLLDFAKEKIQNRVERLHLLINQIYSEYKKDNKPDKLIKRRIFDIIKKFNDKSEEGYFFVTNLKGEILYHGAYKNLIGVNVYSRANTSLSHVHTRILDKIKKDGKGFVKYYWKKKDANIETPKISYVKIFKPYNFILGSGVFVSDIEKEFQKSTIKFLEKYRFGANKNNYIFVLKLFNINGGKNFAQMYVNPNRPDLIGKWLSDDYKDAKGKEFRKEFLRKLREKGEGFVEYWYKKLTDPEPSPKISYFKLTKNGKFIVAAGVYLDDVEKQIAVLQARLRDTITNEIFFSVLFAIIIVLIFIILLNFVLRRTKNDLNLFETFFKNAAKWNTPIDIEKLRFREFVPLAEAANEMLAQKNSAEEELRQDREKLFVTMQSVGDALISTDKEGKVTFLNRVAEKLTGWSNEEASGKKLSEVFNIINEETRKRVDNPVEKVLSTGKIVGLANHTVLISRDGKEYNIADSAAPIKSKEGEIIGIVMVFRDITEEYKVLNALRKSEETNSAIIKALPDLIFVFDNNYVIKSYSANESPNLYTSPEVFLNKKADEVLPPEVAVQAKKSIDEVIANKELVSFRYSLEINGKTHYYEARLTPKGENEVLSVIRDITEQTIAEQKLIESEEKFKKLSLLKKAILESPQGIIVFALDKEYRYLDFTMTHKITMKEIWGVDIEIGKCMLDYIKNEEDRQSAKENFDRALRGESFILIEEYGDEKLLRTFYENRYAPVIDEEGKIIGVSVYVIDITERIRAQKLAEKTLIELEETAEELKHKNKELEEAKQKAEASEKLKSEFLTQISHEIRSPLNVITNFTALVKYETEDMESETLDMAFAGIDSASRRIIRTIELILNMSELQLGTYQSKRNLFNFVDSLNAIRNEYLQTAKLKNLDLIFENRCENKTLYTDDYAFNQIIINLVDNAIKYTNEGYVKIIAERTDKEIIITVKDTGIGISEEYLPILFEPFTQEEQGYHRKFEGNGLGMALIKRYAELIGAEILVESKKGVGTTFEVVIKIGD